MANDIKRVNFDITKELHTKIKIFAAENNISIKIWIMRLIFKEVEFMRLCKKSDRNG